MDIDNIDSNENPFEKLCFSQAVKNAEG